MQSQSGHVCNCNCDRHYIILHPLGTQNTVCFIQSFIYKKFLSFVSFLVSKISKYKQNRSFETLLSEVSFLLLRCILGPHIIILIVSNLPFSTIKKENIGGFCPKYKSQRKHLTTHIKSMTEVINGSFICKFGALVVCRQAHASL